MGRSRAGRAARSGCVISERRERANGQAVYRRKQTQSQSQAGQTSGTRPRDARERRAWPAACPRRRVEAGSISSGHASERIEAVLWLAQRASTDVRNASIEIGISPESTLRPCARRIALLKRGRWYMSPTETCTLSDEGRRRIRVSRPRTRRHRSGHVRNQAERLGEDLVEQEEDDCSADEVEDGPRLRAVSFSLIARPRTWL